MIRIGLSFFPLTSRIGHRRWSAPGGQPPPRSPQFPTVSLTARGNPSAATGARAATHAKRRRRPATTRRAGAWATASAWEASAAHPATPASSAPFVKSALRPSAGDGRRGCGGSLRGRGRVCALSECPFCSSLCVSAYSHLRRLNGPTAQIV